MKSTAQPINLKRLVYLSVLIAMGIVLNVLEPNIFPIPGAKLGLANLVSLLGILWFGEVSGILIAVFRTILGSIIKGNLNIIPFGTSFLGGVFAAIFMALIYRFFKRYFSIIGISIAGGIANNVAQFFFVLAVTRNTAFWYYLPVLVVLGGVSGAAIGLLAKLVYNNINLMIDEKT